MLTKWINSKISNLHPGQDITRRASRFFLWAPSVYLSFPFLHITMYMIKSPRPSHFVFACCEQSKTGRWWRPGNKARILAGNELQQQLNLQYFTSAVSVFPNLHSNQKLNQKQPTGSLVATETLFYPGSREACFRGRKVGWRERAGVHREWGGGTRKISFSWVGRGNEKDIFQGAMWLLLRYSTRENGLRVSIVWLVWVDQLATRHRLYGSLIPMTLL